MKDPVRLTARDTTFFEHRLLDAARNDRIPDAMKQRMCEGLNLGSAVAGSSGAAVAGSSGAAAVLSLKTGTLLVLGTAALAGLVGVALGRGSALRDRRASVAAPLAAREVAALPVVQRAPDEAKERTKEARTAAATEAAPAVSPEPARAASGPRRRPVSAPPVSRGRGVDLREEIGLLDGARAALTAGAPDRSLDLLDQYDHRYPNGTFGPEALALRIEASSLAGDTSKARTLARRFLSQYRDNPLAERVERFAVTRP